MLGPIRSYIDILYTAIDNKKESDIKRLPLRPSNAGECTRALAYQMQEYLGKATFDKKKNDPRVTMLLDLGNSVEYHCIKWFKEASDTFKSKYKQQTVELFELQSDVDKSMHLIIEGSSDDVFWSDTNKAVIDYKSKGDKWSNHRKTNWDEMGQHLEKIAHKFDDHGYWVEDLEAFLSKLNDPYFEANFLQLNCYANSEFYIKRGIDHASIIQYNKNDSSMREIRFKPSKKVFERVKDKFKVALDAAMSDKPELASRDFNLGSIKCAYCPFASQCRPQEDVLKSFYKTLQKTWPKDTNRLGTLGDKLEVLFKERASFEPGIDSLLKTDEDIIALLEKTDVRKIKLDNGEIYELRLLKSPKEHYEIRKSKL